MTKSNAPPEPKKSRLESNRQLLEQLGQLVEKNPNMRFSQILFNFGFVTGVLNSEKQCDAWLNEFSTEPWEVESRLGDMSLIKAPKQDDQ
jgi:hypothetical protein